MYILVVCHRSALRSGAASARWLSLLWEAFAPEDSVRLSGRCVDSDTSAALSLCSNAPVILPPFVIHCPPES